MEAIRTEEEARFLTGHTGSFRGGWEVASVAGRDEDGMSIAL